MSFELKLALKYFRAKRKSLARFTSLVAILGIAVGVASLIIAQSLAKGFQDEMRDKILANSPHISIFMKDGTAISDWQNIKKTLESVENIKHIEPTAFEHALLVGETETSYAVIKVQNLNSNLQSKTQIRVGAKLAEKLNLKIGDSAEILTLESETPTRVKVAEIFETGLFEYDSTWVSISPELFAYLREKPIFTPTFLSVSLQNIYESEKTAQNIRANLGENFKIIDWKEANKPLFAALSLEKKASVFVISLIVFIAVLNITTTLSLLVNERKSDIAILRTCGAKTQSLLKVFLFEGLFLGMIGIFLGVFLGLTACFLGNYFKVVNISADVYSLNYIPFHSELADILITVSIAFVLCLLATVYPAFRASRIKPLENLRNQ